MMKCIHCLTETGVFTQDHIFPDAWYSDNTPLSLQKPTAPSCKKCNNELGKIEEELLRIFSFGFSPKANGHSKIYKKMKRSISEDCVTDLREKEVRKNLKRKFFQNMLSVGLLPEESIVNPNNERIYGDSMGLKFEVESLNKILSKITKGIIYNWGAVKYIPETFEMTFFHFQKPPMEIQSISHLDKQFGPGFKFSYWDDPSFPPNCIVQIQIWQTLDFWVTVENPLLNEKDAI